MFFDETFDGLDPVMRNLVKKLICNDVAEYDTTVIVTSHSLRELEDICDPLTSSVMSTLRFIVGSFVIYIGITQILLSVRIRTRRIIMVLLAVAEGAIYLPVL